jgi:hypothetical protein
LQRDLATLSVDNADSHLLVGKVHTPLLLAGCEERRSSSIANANQNACPPLDILKSMSGADQSLGTHRMQYLVEESANAETSGSSLSEKPAAGADQDFRDTEMPTISSVVEVSVGKFNDRSPRQQRHLQTSQAEQMNRLEAHPLVDQSEADVVALLEEIVTEACIHTECVVSQAQSHNCTSGKDLQSSDDFSAREIAARETAAMGLTLESKVSASEKSRSVCPAQPSCVTRQPLSNSVNSCSVTPDTTCSANIADESWPISLGACTNQVAESEPNRSSPELSTATPLPHMDCSPATLEGSVCGRATHVQQECINEAEPQSMTAEKRMSQSQQVPAVHSSHLLSLPARAAEALVYVHASDTATTREDLMVYACAEAEKQDCNEPNADKSRSVDWLASGCLEEAAKVQELDGSIEPKVTCCLTPSATNCILGHTSASPNDCTALCPEPRPAKALASQPICKEARLSDVDRIEDGWQRGLATLCVDDADFQLLVEKVYTPLLMAGCEERRSSNIADANKNAFPPLDTPERMRGADRALGTHRIQDVEDKSADAKRAVTILLLCLVDEVAQHCAASACHTAAGMCWIPSTSEHSNSKQEDGEVWLDLDEPGPGQGQQNLSATREISKSAQATQSTVECTTANSRSAGLQSPCCVDISSAEMSTTSNEHRNGLPQEVGEYKLEYAHRDGSHVSAEHCDSVANLPAKHVNATVSHVSHHQRSQSLNGGLSLCRSLVPVTDNPVSYRGDMPNCVVPNDSIDLILVTHAVMDKHLQVAKYMTTPHAHLEEHGGLVQGLSGPKVFLSPSGDFKCFTGQVMHTSLSMSTFGPLATAKINHLMVPASSLAHPCAEGIEVTDKESRVSASMWGSTRPLETRMVGEQPTMLYPALHSMQSPSVASVLSTMPRLEQMSRHNNEADQNHKAGSAGADEQATVQRSHVLVGMPSLQPHQVTHHSSLALHEEQV